MEVLRAAQTPTETGSAMAACSAVRPSGARWAKAASIGTSRLIEPSIGGVAKNRTSGHRLYRPARHWVQVRHGTPRFQGDQLTHAGSVHISANIHNDPGRLVADDHGIDNHILADPSVVVVVHIGTADADSCDLDK